MFLRLLDFVLLVMATSSWVCKGFISGIPMTANPVATGVKRAPRLRHWQQPPVGIDIAMLPELMPGATSGTSSMER